MGLFDIFKKKEDDTPKAEPVKETSSGAKGLTVPFGSKTPIPFNDPEYRSLFISYTGEAVLSPKNPDINMESMKEMLALNISTNVGLALSKQSFCYKEFAAKNDELAREVSDALTDYNLISFKLLSFEPDEMSKNMIAKIDLMKQM